MNVVTIERKVLEKNDAVASDNRADFTRHGIFVLNIISSPGSGKTSILEKVLPLLSPEIACAVIEGDVQTDFDAQRIARLDVPVVQIVTNGGCHLEANLIRNALSSVDLDATRLLIIENVGNLVCPANYDLGENIKVVIASTTEGDDKPLKYPGIFQKAALLIINKSDLLPYIDCNIERLKRNALGLNPSLHIMVTSCRTGEGIQEVCDWIKERVDTTGDEDRTAILSSIFRA